MQMILPGRGTGGPISTSAAGITEPRGRVSTRSALFANASWICVAFGSHSSSRSNHASSGTSADASTATAKLRTERLSGSRAPTRGVEVGAVLGVKVIRRIRFSQVRSGQEHDALHVVQGLVRAAEGRRHFV